MCVCVCVCVCVACKYISDLVGLGNTTCRFHLFRAIMHPLQ